MSTAFIGAFAYGTATVVLALAALGFFSRCCPPEGREELYVDPPAHMDVEEEDTP